MASGTDFLSDESSSPSPIEALMNSRNSDVPLFLPFFLSGSHQETENGDDSRDRIILISPFTQTIVVLESSSGFDSLFDRKDGRRPASKASIDAMRTVDIESDGEQCAICLEEWEIRGKVREMPCKHRFCGGCIEKWLRVHGSCPVCRYQMPLEGAEDSDPKR